jgi:hypothetical protein
LQGAFLSPHKGRSPILLPASPCTENGDDGDGHRQPLTLLAVPGRVLRDVLRNRPEADGILISDG